MHSAKLAKVLDETLRKVLEIEQAARPQQNLVDHPADAAILLCEITAVPGQYAAYYWSNSVERITVEGLLQPAGESP